MPPTMTGTRMETRVMVDMAEEEAVVVAPAVVDGSVETAAAVDVGACPTVFWTARPPRTAKTSAICPARAPVIFVR